MDIKKSGGTIGLMDLLGLSRKNASKLDDKNAGTFAELFMQCLMGSTANTESGGGIGASGDTSGDATSFMKRDTSGWAGFDDKVATVDSGEISGEYGQIHEDGIRARTEDGKNQSASARTVINDSESANRERSEDGFAKTTSLRLPQGEDTEVSGKSGFGFKRWTDAGGHWDVFGAGLTVWNDPSYEREYRENITKT